MTTLDPASGTNKIASMVRRFIHNAMRSSIEELLHKPLQEMSGSLQRLESGLRDTNLRIDALGARLDSRIDDGIKQTAAIGARLDSRIDEMGTSLGSRIDEMGARLGARIDEMGARLDIRIDEMGVRIDDMGTRIDETGTRLGSRIDEMGAGLGARIDEMGARLSTRTDDLGTHLDNFANRFSDKFDEFSAQQGRIIEEVASLKGEVAGLKTDQKLVDTLEHRVARIEDRLFSKAV